MVLNRNGSKVEEIDFTIAGFETIRRKWGYQDWTPYGREKGFVREREINPERFSVMLTNRPVLLAGVPENVSIESIKVQKRPIVGTSTAVQFPPEVAYVPHRDNGSQVIEVADSKNWLYLHWGRMYDPQDLSCKMTMNYDAENLYIDFAVTDDRHEQSYPANEVWQGDSLQVAFAAMDADDPAPKSATAYQICRTNDGKTVCLREYSQFGLSTPTAVKVTTEQKGKVLTYRVTFPFKELGVKSPEAGFPLGMALVVNENDGPPRNRRGALLWGNGVVTSKVNPSEFSWLFFRRDHK